MRNFTIRLSEQTIDSLKELRAEYGTYEVMFKKFIKEVNHGL